MAWGPGGPGRPPLGLPPYAGIMRASHNTTSSEPEESMTVPPVPPLPPLNQVIPGEGGSGWGGAAGGSGLVGCASYIWVSYLVPMTLPSGRFPGHS